MKPKKFTIGFTGTQIGMSDNQFLAVRKYLETILTMGLDNVRVIHGDCVGADLEFDTLASLLNIERLIYPCLITSKRAFCGQRGAIEAHPPIDPLERNRLIVDAADVMLATPKELKEELRSGTWATIRYARKQNKLIEVFER